MDPLAGSPWSQPDTVAGFASSAPNARLMHVAAGELARLGRGRALDIGCGAGRNAVPLACAGWEVVGVDLSAPMAAAAAARRCPDGRPGRRHVVLAAMDRLPVRDGAFDLVIAHGIWNLAASDRTLHAAVAEAAPSADVPHRQRTRRRDGPGRMASRSARAAGRAQSAGARTAHDRRPGHLRRRVSCRRSPQLKRSP